MLTRQETAWDRSSLSVSYIARTSECRNWGDIESRGVSVSHVLSFSHPILLSPPSLSSVLVTYGCHFLHGAGLSLGLERLEFVIKLAFGGQLAPIVKISHRLCYFFIGTLLRH